MPPIKPRVLCVASPDWFGVSRLPQLLAQAGCLTTTLTDLRNMSARSRWVDVRLPGTHDPAENLERLRLHLATGAAYDWIMPDDGGAPVLIEFNPRPPPYTYRAGAMGADLPKAIAAFLAGARTVAAPPDGPEAPIVRLFPQDAIRAIESRDWKDCALWLSGMAGSLPWNDPPLFVSYVRQVLRAIARTVR